jgi:hypothetical protein
MNRRVYDRPVPFRAHGNEAVCQEVTTKEEFAMTNQNLNVSMLEEMDLRDSWLNEYLGQKKTTRRQAEIPQRVLSRRSGYKPVWRKEMVSSNRLFRFLSGEKEYLQKVKPLKLKDGTEIKVILQKDMLSLKDCPVLYVQFAADGKDTHEAYELSKKDILEGIYYEGHHYEYCFSSGSQMRTLKGVFVRKDFTYSPDYLENFKGEYRSFLASLTGAEAILEAITYGAYSHEFTNRFALYKGEKVEAPVESPNKFVVRAGMAGTSTISLGRDWNVYHLGEIRFLFTDEVREALREIKIRTRSGQLVRKYADHEIDEIERKWKEALCDGSGIVSAQKLTRELRKTGFNVKLQDVIGSLVQYRHAGNKGTVLAVDEAILIKCQDPDGESVYAGIDLIVEHNSWKYSPTDHYTGKVAPEFELVNISKPGHTNMLNYQFILALDPSSPQKAKEVFDALVDRQIESLRTMFTDPEYALKKLGLIEKGDSPLAGIGVDEYAMNQVSKVTRLVATTPEAVKDAWFRKKVLDLFQNREKDIRSGRVEVEGANRYIITDPTAFLRTDKMVLNKETGLMDIVIDSMSDVALRDPRDCYWNGQDKDAVLFRSPCVHPGEPQKVRLTNRIVEAIETPYGFIPVRKLFESIKDVVVVNGFSTILESMGGADTDGDTVLCTTEPSIVELKDELRKPLVVEVEAPTYKEEITIQGIKENMVRSLKDNGIGIITNYATTWRDIQLTVFMDKAVNPKLQKALREVKTAAMKNMKLEKTWVMEDESIMRLSHMDIDDWQSVYKAINGVLQTLRVLQEMAINTAKSGVFVEFGSLDPDVNNYNHLKVNVSADWHKPHIADKKKYESSSTMGMVDSYMIKEWANLKHWAMKTSSHILPGVEADYGVVYQEVYEKVARMAAEYGSEVSNLSAQGLDPEAFNLEFELITNKYNGMLTILSAQYGVDLVAIAAYDATNRNSSRTEAQKLSSFVWSCFFEEMIATLKFLNRGKTSSRIYRIFLDRRFTYHKFAKGGPCSVDIDRGVYLRSVRIGRSSAPEGEYEVVVIDGAPYVKVEVERDSIQKLSSHLNGVEFPVTGFKYNKDKITGEGFLTRDKVISYIESPLNKNIVVTKTVTLKKGDAPVIALYVRSGDTSHMMIGTLPVEYSVIGRAMNSKAFKVEVAGKEEAESRLTLRIEKALCELL